jgi:hypothetical protein
VRFSCYEDALLAGVRFLTILISPYKVWVPLQRRAWLLGRNAPQAVDRLAIKSMVCRLGLTGRCGAPGGALSLSPLPKFVALALMRGN